jgi:hypothetical protein
LLLGCHLAVLARQLAASRLQLSLTAPFARAGHERRDHDQQQHNTCDDCDDRSS